MIVHRKADGLKVVTCATASSAKTISLAISGLVNVLIVLTELLPQNRRLSLRDVGSASWRHFPVEGDSAVDAFDLDMDVRVVFRHGLSQLGDIRCRTGWQQNQKRKQEQIFHNPRSFAQRSGESKWIISEMAAPLAHSRLIIAWGSELVGP